MNIDWRKTFNFFHQRQRAYRLALGTPAGNQVLLDLSRFCYANASMFDQQVSLDRLEGRREVWLRIQQQMNLSTEDLIALYNGQTIKIGDDNA